MACAQAGGARRRVWRKVPLAVDEAAMEVRGVEITGSHIGDAPILLDLLDQIPEDEVIGSVTRRWRLRHAQVP